MKPAGFPFVLVFTLAITGPPLVCGLPFVLFVCTGVFDEDGPPPRRAAPLSPRVAPPASRGQPVLP